MHSTHAHSRLSRLKTLGNPTVLKGLAAAGGVQLFLLVSGTLSARLLGPQGRGYVAILTTWPSVIGQIGAVGMALAATYYLSSSQVGGREVLRLLGPGARTQVLLLTALNSAIILGYVEVSGAPILDAALISLLLLPIALVQDYAIAFLLGARRHGVANAMRLLPVAIYAIGMVVLFRSHDRATSTVLAIIVGSTAVGAFAAIGLALRAILPLQPRESLVTRVGVEQARRELLAFGRKGFVGYLAPVDTFRMDQLAVGFLVSPRALGFYVVGAAFTNLARLVATYIGLSATPEIAAHTNVADQRAAIRRILKHSLVVITFITVTLAVFVIFAIPIIFGERYSNSIPIAEILFAAGWLLAMKRIAVDTMRGAGEAQVGTRAEIVNVTVFLAILIPAALWLGGIGVALSLVISSACGSVILFRHLRAHSIV